MKNLQNYGVLELNAKEVKEIDGGLVVLALIGVYVGVACLWAACFSIGYAIGKDMAARDSR